jgi:hypothetical protein
MGQVTDNPLFTDTRSGVVDLGADSPVGGAELATYSKSRFQGESVLSGGELRVREADTYK